MKKLYHIPPGLLLLASGKDSCQLFRRDPRLRTDMNKIEPTRAAVFVGVLSIIAFSINSTQSHSVQKPTAVYVSPAEQQEKQVELQQQDAAQKAAAEAATQHAKFLAQYLNAGFIKNPGIPAVAIVVASEDGRFNHVVSTALANHFNSGAVDITSTFFKPQFVSDGLFADAFNGSGDVLNKLDLANSLNALLLARESTQYTQSPALDNLITATMQLEVQVVPVAGSIQNQAWTFTANGAGFSQMQARANAEERLIKQISTDTKMSLNN
jgi:hypothetical protein